MKTKMVFFCVILSLLVSIGAGPAGARQERDITFAVFSDPHFYHPLLGTRGAAFEAYIAQDRKMIRESSAILDAAIDMIVKDKQIRFVLIPGDLTKDGERFNHLVLAAKLKRLEQAGKQVFVVPGNHDVNNPHARMYYKDIEIPIPGVSPGQFEWIYQRYGYRGQALDRDPQSLSYVAEPVPGLWLIAMDACLYDRNLETGTPATGGEFKPESLAWILAKIAEGRARGKQMIGMMHHGLIEHYTGQSVLFEDYVVTNWPVVSQQLADAGLTVVFTGHYHANDVTTAHFEDNFIVDIETGSLVTFPSPVRRVTLTAANTMKIDSRFVKKIDCDTGGQPFPVFAENFLNEGLKGIVYAMLLSEYGLPAGEPALTYASQLGQAFAAHYAGDEAPSDATRGLIYRYLTSTDPATGVVENLIGQYLGTLWQDLTPADNAVEIDLSSGRPVE